MNRIYGTLAMPLLLLSSPGACSNASVAQPPEAVANRSGAAPAVPTREPPMLDATLNGLKSPDGGKTVEGVMYIANFPPGSVSTRHSHPGWEFNYILKGAVTFEVVGQAPYTLKAGEGMYNQRGNIHIVRNASQVEPAQLVSVLVKDAGEPVAVNVP